MDVVAKLFDDRTTVSPIVTLEPRRRKFHRPVTVTIPLPPSVQTAMAEQRKAVAPNLRLLCSLTGNIVLCSNMGHEGNFAFGFLWFFKQVIFLILRGQHADAVG